LTGLILAYHQSQTKINKDRSDRSSKLAGVLPLKWLLALGAGLGRFTFSVLRIRRNVALDNLRHAFPEKSSAELLAIARRNYENFGMMLLEYLRLHRMSVQELAALAPFRSAQDSAPWFAALNAGSAAVCMTGHFGNWEYLGVMLAHHFPVVSLYQSQNNPYVDALIRRTRAKVNMHSIPRQSLKDILKALRQKKFVAILADQDAGRGGLFVNFMGRPASTAQGPAAFVLKTGAPILFVFSLRQPNGKHIVESECLRFDDLPPHWSEEEKLHHITQAWTNVLEKYVRRYPDHWFWMHRRWKTAPPVDASMKVALREKVLVD
ncbi:MAG: lysophospholipid acyltransferase family protein, partial [candidate division KSB1 bacterium]